MSDGSAVAKLEMYHPFLAQAGSPLSFCLFRAGEFSSTCPGLRHSIIAAWKNQLTLAQAGGQGLIFGAMCVGVRCCYSNMAEGVDVLVARLMTWSLEEATDLQCRSVASSRLQ